VSAEKGVFDALRALAADRVFPDFAPDAVARPYVTYQQVGGFPINFLEASLPDMKNGRFRINVWADTRAQASALCAQVEAAMRSAAALQVTVLTSPVALADPETRLRGTSQDFSVWVPS
jgi:hypothetical protein